MTIDGMDVAKTTDTEKYKTCKVKALNVMLKIMQVIIFDICNNATSLRSQVG